MHCTLYTNICIYIKIQGLVHIYEAQKNDPLKCAMSVHQVFLSFLDLCMHFSCNFQYSVHIDTHSAVQC